MSEGVEPTDELNRQRVVVTGSASGIGAATVRRLAAAGADVVTVDRVPLSDDLANLSAEHHLADLSTPDGVAAVADRIEGDIDALCNVAGVPGTLDPVTVLAVNFLALRELTERLVDRITDGGGIVHVASLAGAGWRANLQEVERLAGTPSFEDGLAWAADQAIDGARAYNLSKEAVIVWAMQTCLRWWDRAVRVNCVSPGPVETPILDDFRDSMGAERIQMAIEMVGRAGTPDDIAAAIVFLASRQAPWVNGVNLAVDGGLGAIAAAAGQL